MTMLRGSNLGRGKMFSSFPKRPGAYPASCSVDTGVPSWGSRVHHIPPPSADVKKEWSYTTTPHIRLHSVNRDNITFFIVQIIAFLTHYNAH